MERPGVVIAGRLRHDVPVNAPDPATLAAAPAAAPSPSRGDAPLRTIQVVNVRWFNATAWYGMMLARLLREAGHETLVLGLAGTESFERARAWGLDPIPLPLNAANPFTLAGLYGSLHRIVRDFRPHVVNCHRGEAFVLWGLLKALHARGPHRFGLVRTRGDQRLPKGNRPNLFLHTRVADAVIATNSVMAGHFIHEMGVPADRVHTILGGVDEAVFRFDAAGRARVRAEYDWADSDFVVGLLGRFDAVKGQRELIETVAGLRAGRWGGTPRQNLRLMLAGFDSATPEATVRGWLREAGLEDISVITGKRPDVAACISAMDLGVVASLWSETIARAALEIMACDRPLVSTTVGVMPDLLPHGALVPPGDAAAMAGAIAHAMDSPPWLEILRDACGLRIESLHRADFLNRTLDVYRDVCRGVWQGSCRLNGPDTPDGPDTPGGPGRA